MSIRYRRKQRVRPEWLKVGACARVMRMVDRRWYIKSKRFRPNCYTGSTGTASSSTATAVPGTTCYGVNSITGKMAKTILPVHVPCGERMFQNGETPFSVKIRTGTIVLEK